MAMADDTLANPAVEHQTPTHGRPEPARALVLKLETEQPQPPLLSLEENARADSPTSQDLSTPTQDTPTKTIPVFIATDFPSDEPEEQLSTSPQPTTPTAPATPLTLHDELPDLHDPCRDSMSSIALSDSSLDYDHLSANDVEDILATPRVSGVRGHLRRVSSLDIFQNKRPTLQRQSTLFDTSYESMQPMSAMELEADTQHFWARDNSNFNASDINHDRTPTNTSMDTIDFLGSGQSTYTSWNGSTSAASHRTSDASSSDDDVQVDWQALEKTEKQEKADKDLEEDANDESTAFLLARLEQENAKIEAGAMAASIKSGKPGRARARARAASRPLSMAHLKKLVSGKDTSTPSIRFSLASDTGFAEEDPPMTELEFWVALVQDYPSTAARLPTLTTTKIRAGVPAPLRGVVWTTLAGARDGDLEDAFDRLVHEKSSYEGIINKDVGRSFPGVELFREADGEGQQMLGRVLKCFSLQDKDIGYCQGLGFLVGPLLMNMPERDAFCVLTRLMDHYSLRPSFLPSLSGLHMRIYQFSSLLKQHHSKLQAHLTELGIEPAYLSQWFLSCFAVTCPLDMLFRIYDVIFAEGANETVMRVALALMKRHEEKMLATTEFEDVMQLLLGRQLWDCYGGDADMLVDDFTSLGDIVTHARLAELEKEFENQSSETVEQSAGFLPDVQAAASRFLGRMWAPGHGATPSKASTAPTHSTSPSVSTLSPPSIEKESPSGGYSLFGRPSTFLRRSPSKQSMGIVNDTNSSEDSTSTAGSSAVSIASTAATEPDTPTAYANGVMRESIADSISTRSKAESIATGSGLHNRETMELHTQVEDLLIAIGEMQREHAQLAAMLQCEREERTEDQRIVRQLVGKLRKTDKDDRRKTMPPPQKKMELEAPFKGRPLSVGSRTDVESQLEKQQPKSEIDELLEKAQERLSNSNRFSASLETKAQLRSTLARTREQLEAAAKHSDSLTSLLEAAEASVTTFQTESEDLQTEVTELRTRVAEEFKTRQKLEHQLGELKAQARSVERKERLQRTESWNDAPTLGKNDYSSDGKSRQSSITSLSAGSSGGLRELKLGRRDSSPSVHNVRSASRNTMLVQTEVVLPAIRKDSGSSGEPSPTSVSASPPTPATVTAPSAQHPLAVPRTGFARRTTSLATKEVLATTQHEPVPEDALLLELVNAKTSEAQARQEVDELKRALSVGKRKQEEALKQLQAEKEALKAEAVKAAKAAQEAKSENEALRLSELASAGTTLFSLPPTPALETRNGFLSRGSSAAATPAEEKDQPIVLPKRAESASAAAGSWFWQRRAASKSGLSPALQKDGE